MAHSGLRAKVLKSICVSLSDRARLLTLLIVCIIDSELKKKKHHMTASFHISIANAHTSESGQTASAPSCLHGFHSR